MDKKYFLNFLSELLNIDSPSGYTFNAIKFLKLKAEELGYNMDITNNGNGIITVKGSNEDVLGLCAHVDTLGLVVSNIKNNGRISFMKIGGPSLPSLDSENCKIYTRDGKCYIGTIQCTSPSVHVYDDAQTKERNLENLELVLDEIVKNKEDVKFLGIQNGDVICIDPKIVITDNGFIKSRFLDDKLSVAIIFALLKYIKDNNITPEKTLRIFFTTFEEVGHGMSNISSDVHELIAVDMGCVGKDLESDEYKVCICAKDASGPYDYNIVSKMINLSKKYHLDYAVDVFNHYSSDLSACIRGGNDVKGTVIGAGVFASHGYERAHYNGAENTFKLLLKYITE